MALHNALFIVSLSNVGLVRISFPPRYTILFTQAHHVDGTLNHQSLLPSMYPVSIMLSVTFFLIMSPWNFVVDSAKRRSYFGWQNKLRPYHRMSRLLHTFGWTNLLGNCRWWLLVRCQMSSWLRLWTHRSHLPYWSWQIMPSLPEMLLKYKTFPRFEGFEETQMCLIGRLQKGLSNHFNRRVS